MLAPTKINIFKITSISLCISIFYFYFFLVGQPVLAECFYKAGPFQSCSSVDTLSCNDVNDAYWGDNRCANGVIGNLFLVNTRINGSNSCPSTHPYLYDTTVECCTSGDRPSSCGGGSCLMIDYYLDYVAPGETRNWFTWNGGLSSATTATVPKSFTGPSDKLTFVGAGARQPGVSSSGAGGISVRNMTTGAYYTQTSGKIGAACTSWFDASNRVSFAYAYNACNPRQYLRYDGTNFSWGGCYEGIETQVGGNDLETQCGWRPEPVSPTTTNEFMLQVPVSDLAPGDNVLIVSVLDSGTGGGCYTKTYTINIPDTTPPVCGAFTSVPISPTNSNFVTFSSTASDGETGLSRAGLYARNDTAGTDYAIVPNNAVLSPSVPSYTINYGWDISLIPDGNYTVRGNFWDTSGLPDITTGLLRGGFTGNLTQCTMPLQIDKTPPNCSGPSCTINISNACLNSPTARTFTWTAFTDNLSGVARYLVRINDRTDPNYVYPDCNGTVAPGGDVCDDYVNNNFYTYTFQPGHAYDIWVHAMDNAGNLLWGNVISQNNITFPQVPTAVNNLTATNNVTNAVNLSWSDSQRETTYEVFRSGTLIATLPANTTSYTDTTGVCNTNYNYIVRARNSCGILSSGIAVGRSLCTNISPVCSINSPAANTSFARGSNFNVTSSITDSDGSIVSHNWSSTSASFVAPTATTGATTVAPNVANAIFPVTLSGTDDRGGTCSVSRNYRTNSEASSNLNNVTFDRCSMNNTTSTYTFSIAGSPTGGVISLDTSSATVNVSGFNLSNICARSGVTCRLNGGVTSLSTLSNSGSYTVTISVSNVNSLPIGSYGFRVNLNPNDATLADVSRSALFQVNEIDCNISATVSPSSSRSQVATRGATSTFPISIGSSANFTGSVVPSATCPVGFSCSFSPASVTAPIGVSTQNINLNVSVPSGASTGTFTIPVTFTGTRTTSGLVKTAALTTAATMPTLTTSNLPPSCPVAPQITINSPAPSVGGTFAPNTIVNVSARNGSDPEGDALTYVNWSASAATVQASGVPGQTKNINLANLNNICTNVSFTVRDSNGNTSPVCTYNSICTTATSSSLSISPSTLDKLSCATPTSSVAVSGSYTLSNYTNGSLVIDTTSATISGVQNICAVSGVTCTFTNSTAIADGALHNYTLNVTVPRAVPATWYRYRVILRAPNNLGVQTDLQTAFSNIQVLGCPTECVINSPASSVRVNPGATQLFTGTLSDYDQAISTTSSVWYGRRQTPPFDYLSANPILGMPSAQRSASYTFPNINNGTRYTIRLSGPTPSNYCTWNVTIQNQAPAKPVLTLAAPDTCTNCSGYTSYYSDKYYNVTASGMSDSENDPLTYNWTSSSATDLASEPDSATINSPYSNIVKSFSPDVGIAQINYSVFDGFTSVAADPVQIPVAAPEFDLSAEIRTDLSNIYDETEYANLCEDTDTFNSLSLNNRQVTATLQPVVSTGSTSDSNPLTISPIPEGTYNLSFSHAYGGDYQVLCIRDMDSSPAVTYSDQSFIGSFIGIREETRNLRVVIGRVPIVAWYQAVGGDVYAKNLNVDSILPPDSVTLFNNGTYNFNNNRFLYNNDSYITYLDGSLQNELLDNGTKIGLVQLESDTAASSVQNSITSGAYSVVPSSLNMLSSGGLASYIFDTTYATDGPIENLDSGRNNLKTLRNKSGSIYELLLSDIGTVNLNTFASRGEGSVLIIKDGDLTISGNLTKNNPNSTHVLFAVSGDLSITQDVQLIEASFIVGGQVTINGIPLADANAEQDLPFILRGSILSKGEITSNRSSRLQNNQAINGHARNTRPIDTFIFQPNMYFEDIPLVLQQTPLYVNTID